MGKIMIPLLFGALLAASLPAQFGVDGDELWQFLVKTYDKDKDGKVSKEEYDRGAEKFTKWDANGDGVLSADDFGGDSAGNRGGRGRRGGRQPRDRAAMALRILGPRIARLANKDDDRAISAKEWKAFLASLQADADGVIAEETLAILIGDADRDSSDRQGQGQRRRRRGLNPRMLLRLLDGNDNGKLETQDLQAWFASVDQDKDGAMQVKELGLLPQAGDPAPDFDLPLAEDKSKSIQLSSFAGAKPVALIFGSYT